MKLTAQERAQRRAAFRQMGWGEKLEYLFAYYKLPIFLGALALFLLAWTLTRALTWREPVLYVGFLNVAVGEDLTETLGDGFLEHTGGDVRRQTVTFYPGLYLSENPAAENHQYSYASRLKVLAAINAKQLDLVFMNREAYDILSHSGYLLPLPDFLAAQSPEWEERIRPYLRKNDVILRDNAIEYDLGEAESYSAVTETVVNAMEVSASPTLREAAFPQEVYLGLIANSPRTSADLAYLRYLFL